MLRKMWLTSIASLFMCSVTMASPITVPDFSWETPSTAPGTSLNISNTTIPGAWNSTLYCYIDNPLNPVGNSGESWSTPIPDGTQVFKMAGSGGSANVQEDQSIPVTWVAGQTYTFSVWVGNDWAAGANGSTLDYAVRVFGQNPLGSPSNKYLFLGTPQPYSNPVDNVFAVAPGQWVDVVGSYTVAANDSLVAGTGAGTLELNLTDGLGYGPTDNADIFFDDFQVSVSSVPEPSTILLLTGLGISGCTLRRRERLPNPIV
jgi:hypothetical protein